MKRRLAASAVATIALSVPIFTASAGAGPDETPAQGRASNLGVCSPFLGQLGVRPMINHTIRDFGHLLPDGPYDNVGELYRERARQKPTTSAAEECLPRSESPTD